jgi:hypothetical protein
VATRWLLIGKPDWTPLTAWADGLRSVGLDAVWTYHHDFMAHACDAVAIYGLRGSGGDILSYFAKRGVPVVVLDHGYMKRVNVEADLRTGYLQVSMGGLGWTPATAPSTDRFDALGVTPRQRTPRSLRRAVIMGQVPFDASHRLSAEQLTARYEAIAAELAAAGIPEIAFRGHPLGHGVCPRIQADGIRSLADALAGADLVVSLNSNAGLDAILDGCPAATCMPSHYGELAYQWPVRPAVIAPPPPTRILSFLARLAYAQWTDPEIRQGKPLAFLQSIGAIP